MHTVDEKRAKGKRRNFDIKSILGEPSGTWLWMSVVYIGYFEVNKEFQKMQNGLVESQVVATWLFEGGVDNVHNWNGHQC
ncbi:hypothetical protein EYC80_006976 [Monilinia laxa]|uniref:Uncharacterized protein n=1 Tax=Monilinia laxa TaxID=61186 RepID=A0A5N6JZZ2_MONLA|nr:hypothetical protein EYC80_006976 [Monilinia laxa]